MPGNRLLPVVAVALAALLCIAAGVLWWRMRAAPPAIGAAPQPAASSAQRLNEPLVITLFVPVNGLLAAVQAPVTRQPDPQSLAREALAALFADPTGSQAPVLKDLRLRGVYLDAAGTGYIDLAPVEQREVRASVWEELIALYAMVNTLSQNFEEIRQVRFLVDGREVQTLAGHIELSRKFTKRMDLVKQ
jgi:germination protein M